MFKMLRNKKVFFLVLFLLFFSNFTFYINADENNNNSPFLYFISPENSFGMSSYRYVNWSFFDESFSYIKTVDNVSSDYELEIEFDEGVHIGKYKYKFKTDVAGFYGLEVVFNSFSDDFYFDLNNYTFVSIYSDGNIYFNFTDIINSFDGIVSYWVVDGIFHLKMENYYNVDVEVELDPTIGETGTGYPHELVILSTSMGGKDQYIGGLNVTAPSTIAIDSISAYLMCTIADNSVTLKAVIYEADGTGDMVTNGMSNPNAISVGTSHAWYTFTYTSKPCLTSGEDYFICISGDADTLGDGFTTYTLSVDRNATAGGPNHYAQTTDIYDSYPAYPDPVTWNYHDYDGTISIYATYTGGCGGCTNETLISTNSTSNNSVNIDFCDDLNYTVDLSIDSDCGCSNIDFVNISCDSLSVYSNSTNVGNGTYNLTLPDLVCGTQYQVNVSAMSCNGSINNSYFLFTTRNCCDTTIEGVDNSSLLSYDYNRTYLNLTDYGLCINSSCNSTLKYVNISVVGENFSNVSSVSEGCNLNINVTGLTLICNTDYKVYINTSSVNCSSEYQNSSWFWLNTSNCPIICNCLLLNENYANKTTGVNNSGVGYKNFTIDYNITCGNFTNAYINISVLNMSRNISISSNGTSYLNYTYNFSCGQNITWYVNLTGPNCNNYSTFWFTTIGCGGVSCCDCWNDSCFLNSLENYLTTNGYIQQDDIVQLEFTSSFLSIFLTLVFFIFFLFIGYTINKRSAGFFLMFSGFIFLALEYIIASYLPAIVIGLFGLVGIFIIILGVRKWLYPVGDEKTKSEGQ